MTTLNRRPLLQPLAPAPAIAPDAVQCSNAADEKFTYTHPAGLYEYWYQRAQRDGSKRGEVRVRIAEQDFVRFTVKNKMHQALFGEALIRVTKGKNGWWLVTGSQLPKLDEVTRTFHDPVGAWLRAFNLFFSPCVDTRPEVLPKPEKNLKVVVADNGKILVQRPAATSKALEQLASRFNNRR